MYRCPRPHCGGRLAPERDDPGCYACLSCARRFRKAGEPEPPRPEPLELPHVDLSFLIHELRHLPTRELVALLAADGLTVSLSYVDRVKRRYSDSHHLDYSKRRCKAVSA